MDLRERLVGGWALDSYEAHDDTGQPVYPFGHGATGMIMWTANGAFAAQISPGEAEGDADLPYVAYFGTWDIDEAAMEAVHTVTGANNPRLLHTVQRRGLSFEGDCVTLRPPPMPGPDGRTITMRVRWRRLAVGGG